MAERLLLCADVSSTSTQVVLYVHLNLITLYQFQSRYYTYRISIGHNFDSNPCVCQCHSKPAFPGDPQFSPLWFMKPFPFTAMSSFLQQPIQSISCSINGKGRDHRLKALCPIAINDPL